MPLTWAQGTDLTTQVGSFAAFRALSRLFVAILRHGPSTFDIPCSMFCGSCASCRTMPNHRPSCVVHRDRRPTESTRTKPPPRPAGDQCVWAAYGARPPRTGLLSLEWRSRFEAGCRIPVEWDVRSHEVEWTSLGLGHVVAGPGPNRGGFGMVLAAAAGNGIAARRFGVVPGAFPIRTWPFASLHRLRRG